MGETTLGGEGRTGVGLVPSGVIQVGCAITKRQRISPVYQRNPLPTPVLLHQSRGMDREGVVLLTEKLPRPANGEGTASIEQVIISAGRGGGRLSVNPPTATASMRAVHRPVTCCVRWVESMTVSSLIYSDQRVAFKFVSLKKKALRADTRRAGTVVHVEAVGAWSRNATGV